MKNVLFFTLTLFVTIASAQNEITYPYNPDSDGDQYVSVSDVLSTISSFGSEFNPAEIQIDGVGLAEFILELQNQSSADLSNAGLSNAQLSGVDLSYANLSDANLSDADLSGADLSGAILGGADLTGADLSGANLYGAELNGAGLPRIAAGYYHTVYGLADGTAMSVGYNGFGQLGDGTTTDRSTAVVVQAADGTPLGTGDSGAVIAVAAGWGHTIYGLDDGTAMGVGNNYYGQLGNGGTSGSNAANTALVAVLDVNLYGADLTGADLSGANLSGVTWTGAYIQGCSGCDCIDADGDNICD